MLSGLLRNKPPAVASQIVASPSAASAGTITQQDGQASGGFSVGRQARGFQDEPGRRRGRCYHRAAGGVPQTGQQQRRGDAQSDRHGALSVGGGGRVHQQRGCLLADGQAAGFNGDLPVRGVVPERRSTLSQGTLGAVKLKDKLAAVQVTGKVHGAGGVLH